MDEDGNWTFRDAKKAFKADVWSTEVGRRNLLKAFRDLLIRGLIATLFKLWFSEVYKDHKKNSDGRDIATNAAIEILYKSSTSCFDTFYGPFALLDYVGNQTNPATYRVQSKVLGDVWSFAIGDKTFGRILSGSQALPRTF